MEGDVVSNSVHSSMWQYAVISVRTEPLCSAQASVLVYAVFHVVVFHFLSLGLFPLFGLRFVLAHIVFLGPILAYLSCFV